MARQIKSKSPVAHDGGLRRQPPCELAGSLRGATHDGREAAQRFGAEQLVYGMAAQRGSHRPEPGPELPSDIRAHERLRPSPWKQRSCQKNPDWSPPRQGRLDNRLDNVTVRAKPVGEHHAPERRYPVSRRTATEGAELRARSRRQ